MIGYVLVVALLLPAVSRAELADEARAFSASAEKLAAERKIPLAITELKKIISLYEGAGINLCQNALPLEASFRIGELQEGTPAAIHQYKSIAERCGDQNARKRQAECEALSDLDKKGRELYFKAVAISRRIERTGGNSSDQLERLSIWEELAATAPRKDFKAFIRYLRATTLHGLTNSGVSPYTPERAQELAAAEYRMIIKEFPEAMFPAFSQSVPSGGPIAAYAQFGLADLLNDPNEYERLAANYKTEKDWRGGLLSTNALVRQLNLYSDWENGYRAPDRPKALSLAKKFAEEIPDQEFYAGMYYGHTRPHALLILGALEGDKEKAAEFLLSAIKNFSGSHGGPLGKDGYVDYGGNASRILGELLAGMPVDSAIRQSIEAKRKSLETK